MNHPLWGVWSLQSWTPREEAVAGFIFYAAEGTMAVSIYERDAARLLTSYVGRYEYSGHEVIHYPMAGSSPNGIQDKKIRRVQVEADHIIMETGQDRLVWQRLSHTGVKT